MGTRLHVGSVSGRGDNGADGEVAGSLTRVAVAHDDGRAVAIVPGYGTEGTVTGNATAADAGMGDRGWKRPVFERDPAAGDSAPTRMGAD